MIEKYDIQTLSYDQIPPSPTPSTPLGKGVYPVRQGGKGCSIRGWRPVRNRL